jgi:hypothetical protein
VHNDLLDRLLSGRDPKTGQGLSDENVMYQLITFLIAGALVARCFSLPMLTPIVQATRRRRVRLPVR